MVTRPLPTILLFLRLYAYATMRQTTARTNRIEWKENRPQLFFNGQQEWEVDAKAPTLPYQHL